MEYQNTSNNCINLRSELQQIESKYHEKNLFEELIEDSVEIEENSQSRDEQSSYYNESGVQTRTATQNQQLTNLVVQQPPICKKIYVNNISNVKKNMCKCQKTQCIKDYCPCHRNNKKCSRSCQCIECRNKQIQFNFKTNIQNFWQFSHYLRQ